MQTTLLTVYPSFWERLAFLIERFLRLQAIGQSLGTGFDFIPAPVTRSLTEDEIAEGQFIRLSSAVRHLQWGITHSTWSKDSYLERLQQATAELRSRSLAEYGVTEITYQEWLVRYAVPAVTSSAKEVT